MIFDRLNISPRSHLYIRLIAYSWLSWSMADGSSNHDSWTFTLKIRANLPPSILFLDMETIVTLYEKRVLQALVHWPELPPRPFDSKAPESPSIQWYQPWAKAGIEMGASSSQRSTNLSLWCRSLSFWRRNNLHEPHRSNEASTTTLWPRSGAHR